MAIEFVLEDGTGKSDATSYVSEAEFVQYWENKGVDYSATLSADVKAALNSATEYIDMYYTFKGKRTFIDVQSLEFPRTGLLNEYACEYIDSDEIPTELKNATSYLASKTLATGFDTTVNPLMEDSQNISSERVGTVSYTYNGGYLFTNYRVANSYLKHFIFPGTQLTRVN